MKSGPERTVPSTMLCSHSGKKNPWQRTDRIGMRSVPLRPSRRLAKELFIRSEPSEITNQRASGHAGLFSGLHGLEGILSYCTVSTVEAKDISPTYGGMPTAERSADYQIVSAVFNLSARQKLNVWWLHPLPR